MVSTADGYTYSGHTRDKLTFRPYSHAAGTPAVLVEGPGTALVLKLEQVEPFIDDLRAVAAGARRNHAVSRRPWTLK